MKLRWAVTTDELYFIFMKYRCTYSDAGETQFYANIRKYAMLTIDYQVIVRIVRGSNTWLIWAPKQNSTNFNNIWLNLIIVDVNNYQKSIVKKSNQIQGNLSFLIL